MKPIPAQHSPLMPYLIVPDAYRFLEFMKSVFNAKEQAIILRSEGVIMHGELRIGDAVIMFADTTSEITARPAGIFIYTENVDRLYEKAMASGCISLMKPQQQPYGYTCGFRDVFDNDWWPVEPG